MPPPPGPLPTVTSPEAIKDSTTTPSGPDANPSPPPAPAQNVPRVLLKRGTMPRTAQTPAQIAVDNAANLKFAQTQARLAEQERKKRAEWIRALKRRKMVREVERGIERLWGVQGEVEDDGEGG